MNDLIQRFLAPNYLTPDWDMKENNKKNPFNWKITLNQTFVLKIEHGESKYWISRRKLINSSI